MKCDELKQVEYPIEWGLYYDKAEVDALLSEKDKEIRRLKRALWLARAERAKDNAIRYGIYGPAIKSLLWSGVDAKCRAKAEQYK